ncbi:MAG: membrane protein insertion efficiency factor YidD [Patescibacteria group bacterium]
MLKRLIISLIKLYQRTLSLDTGWFRHNHPGGYCRFAPHCSQYGIEAIEKYGVVVGGAKTAWRIVRCNPWSKGGEDPVR